MAIVGLVVGIAIGALLGGGLLATPSTVTTTVYQTTTQTVTNTVTTTAPPVTQTVTMTQTVVRTETVTATPKISATDVELRRHIGSLVGRHFLGTFPTVAVVTQPNTLCSALAASALASLPSYSRGFFVMYNASAPEVSAKAAAGASAVFLAFGGEEPAAVADKSLRDFLAALAKTGFEGALIVHSRAWAVTNSFKTVLNDTRVAAFVKERPIYVVTLNATHLTISQFNATAGRLTPRLFIDRNTGEVVRRYTEAESLFLRSSVGRVAGAFLFQGYGKVAIITGTDPACVALSAAAYASSRANATRIVVYTGDVEALSREISAYGPDAVFIAFGGDMPSYAISKATRDVLTALRKSGYRGDVLLHAFVLRATNLLGTVLDADLSQWLGQRTVKGIAPDLPNRRVNIVQFAVSGNMIQPQTVITSLPMPEAIADVLARVVAS